jgi:S1-C subfamily serine protease
MKAHGWLGLETEKNAAGAYAVKAVTPGSPAAAAGFQPGDVLVAFNGVAMDGANKEAMKKAKAGSAPGKQVTYTVRRGGAERQLTATLAPVPKEVLAQWLGEHLIDEHLSTAVARANP